jgi:hypothetical protein
LIVANWTFLTSHARVLLCIAHDPGGLDYSIAPADRCDLDVRPTGIIAS